MLTHRARKHLVLALLAAGAIAAGVLGLIFLDELIYVATHTTELLQEHLVPRPWLFFVTMAILPALGAPVIVFYFLAGLYRWELALPAAGLAIFVNLVLSYYLSTRLLRPVCLWLLARRNWKMPSLKEKDALQVGMMLRLAPGLPMFLQSTAMALAGVPFREYLVISWPIQMAWCGAAMILGKSFFTGQGGWAVTGVLALVFLILLVNWLRQKYAARKIGSAP